MTVYKKRCTCLAENTKKCLTFTVPIEKQVTRIYKNGEEIAKDISYILQFVNNTRVMTSSLSNFVNNPSEEIHSVKCKFWHDDKKCETCGIKYKYCDCFLEYTDFKNNLIEYKCLCCDKNYQHNFDEKLKEQFFNTYRCSNHDNSKFILLLRKGVFILMNI